MLPVREKSVAQKFIDGASMRLHQLAAALQPRRREFRNILPLHTPRHFGESLQIRDKQPAWHGAHLQNGSICAGGNLGPRTCHRLRLPEREMDLADGYAVSILKRTCLNYATSVEVGSVDASEIDQNEIVLGFAADDRMLARGLGIIKNQLAGRGSAQRATLLQLGPDAI